MTIDFTRAEGLTGAQIAELEAILQRPLPPDIKTHLQQYSNARPLINNTPCCFKIVHADGWETSAYVEYIDPWPSLKDRLKEMDYLEDFVAWFELSADYVEWEFLFPVAVTSNGVLLAAAGGKHVGKVYVADSGDFGIVYVCESLDNFWNSVYDGMIL